MITLDKDLMFMPFDGTSNASDHALCIEHTHGNSTHILADERQVNEVNRIGHVEFDALIVCSIDAEKSFEFVSIPIGL
jgi:hypothetical protein